MSRTLLGAVCLGLSGLAFAAAGEASGFVAGPSASIVRADPSPLMVGVRAVRVSGARGGAAAGRARAVAGPHGAAAARGAVAVGPRGNVAVGRAVAVARPVRPWVRRPYYGTVVAGVALGTIVAATAVAVAPPAPASNVCWFWADAGQTRGYWDYCR